VNIFKLIKLPDLVTLASIALAMLSIFSSIQRDFIYAAVFMALSVIADYFDGAIARWTNRKGNFGKQMDSLADVIAFGISPAVFGYMLLGRDITNILILILFVFAGVLRLARFNISPSTDYFEGFPITSSGIIIPLFYLLKFPTAFLLYVYLILAILMISSIKVKKFKLDTNRNLNARRNSKK